MRFLKDENGQGLVEYGMILGLIAVLTVAIIVLLGKRTKGSFKSSDDALSNANIPTE